MRGHPRHHGRRFAHGGHGTDLNPFRRHGRGGPGRVFGGGDLRLVLLHLLAEKPSHGYELIKALEERAGGAYSPSPGVIYPTLTLLEELGHAAAAPAEGGRKLHAATEEGRAFLAANREAADALLARLDSRAQAAPPAPVVRAMENLKLALRLRLSRGTLDEAGAQAVAAALDAAAIAVERS